MSKALLSFTSCRKAISCVSAPSPEIQEFASLNPKPKRTVNVRKLKSEEIAKVATILDFNDDYEVCHA